MSMICRPILLHNEYVPAITGKREYKYLVLGHHDGMTVGDALPIDTTGSFEKIFSFNTKFGGQKSDYSTQFFYGFHKSNDDEKSFWESSLPFTFVAFIQFEGEKIAKYQKYLESQKYKRDEAEVLNLAERLDTINIIAYYALDSSSVILVIKCSKCSTGTQMLNNLHQDVCNRHPFSVRNSYSILAINRDYIDGNKPDLSVEGHIEKLELRIIERKKSSVNGLYNELENILKEQDSSIVIDRKGLMGTEDEAIIIENVRWKHLLPLYKEGTGILKNSNICSQKYASAITTKILYSIMAEENNRIQEIEIPNIPTPFCDYLYQKIEMIYDKQCNASALTERKNLVMLVNALRKIEYSSCIGKNFNDYCFFTIMMPTAMFIRLREKENNNAAEFYEFIKYIKLCMQNFTKPDRVYQQITDFNIRYFDIPSKLVALYNAYLYYAKQALNVGLKGEYEFLLCPGMNMKTEVKELYQGTDSKDEAKELPEEIKSHHLFRVEIPESHIYNLKLMFFVLGHEVSHFVGRMIRKREDRYKRILKLISRMTAIGIKEWIGYINEFDDVCFENIIWDNIENKLYTQIQFHIESHLSLEYMKGIEYKPDEVSEKRIKKQINYYKIFYRHTSTLKMLLNKVVDMILHFKSDEIFDELIWKDINTAISSKKISYEERKQYYGKQKSLIEKCIEDFMGTKDSWTTDLTLLNGIEDIMYLLEECYADLSCILLLQLSLKDYLGNFVKILESIGYKAQDIEDTKIITRVALVMAAMNYKIEEVQDSDLYFIWNNSEILLCEEKEIMCLQEQALDFAEAYIDNEVNFKPGKMAEDIQRINLDSKILKEILGYLLNCRREYCRQVKHKDREKVQIIYELANLSEADNFFEKSTIILNKYENDIYEEIQKLKEGEERNHGK